MRIATWNVNSIKQRLDNVLTWLKEREPDVVCLQETKCVDDAFPRETIEALGYNVAVHGQKAFNGVAVLSKLRFDEVTPRLPGDNEDDHARFLEVVVSSDSRAVRIASIYLPNGNPPETDKYAYKLSWMDRLARYARERLQLEEPMVLAEEEFDREGGDVVAVSIENHNLAPGESTNVFVIRDGSKPWRR